MEKVFSDTEKEQFKTLVKADQPEPKLPKRYSENDFQGQSRALAVQFVDIFVIFLNDI